MATRARIVAHRADTPYGGVEELWRRAGVPGRRAGAAWPRRTPSEPRPGPAPGAVGDPRPGRRGAAAVRRRRPRPPAGAGTGRAAGRAGADDRGRRGGRGLPQHRSEPAPPPGRVPARGTAPAGRSITCADLARTRDGRRVDRGGHRAGPAAAGQRARRAVHHHRGRDRVRQPYRLALGVRAAAPADPERQHAGLPRPACSARARSSM